MMRIAVPAFFLRFACPLLLFCGAVFGQSSNQNFPTPVRSNEIEGTIKARDLGDSRLTTHFYSFIGNQGDIFINIVTKNFDGDIDVFAADTLKPVTKIVVYSDTTDQETGRVIYVRQSQRLLLRIEGRTPNDDPAKYRIKFAGSFAPSEDIAAVEDPKVSEKTAKNDPEVKVNSAGTIIAVKPKPTPKPAEPAVKEETAKTEKPSDKTKPVTDAPKESNSAKVVLTDPLPKESAPKDKPKTETPAKVKPKTQPKSPTAKTPAKPQPKPEAKSKESAPPPNPLAGVRLVVLFKDGAKIERPIVDVIKFSIDSGVLTIINKDGSIGRYKLVDIAKIVVE